MTEEPEESARRVFRQRLRRLRRRLILIEFSGLAYAALTGLLAEDDDSRHVIVNRAVLIYADIRSGKLCVTKGNDGT